MPRVFRRKRRRSIPKNTSESDAKSLEKVEILTTETKREINAFEEFEFESKIVAEKRVKNSNKTLDGRVSIASKQRDKSF